MRLVKFIIIMALFASMVYAVKNFVPIKHVRIQGTFTHISKDELKTLLEPLVKVSFFDANVQGIKDVLSSLSWVDNAVVNRVWPDTLAIKINEKTPYVRWGKNVLISTHGLIIKPEDITPFMNLPILFGPEGQEMKSIEIMKGVNTALVDQSMQIAEFSINDRWAWKIKLNSGLEILLGRSEQLKKLQRFIKTIDVVGPEQLNAMSVVDLRYPNGYAVSWKLNVQPIDWKTLPAAQTVNK
jgi:cell division protein FtsQ